MSEIKNNTLYENPSLDVELFAAITELFQRHGLDGGGGDHALAAVLVVSWEFADKATDRFVVNTAHDMTGRELLTHALSALGRVQAPGQ